MYTSWRSQPIKISEGRPIRIRVLSISLQAQNTKLAKWIRKLVLRDIMITYVYILSKMHRYICYIRIRGRIKKCSSIEKSF